MRGNASKMKAAIRRTEEVVNSLPVDVIQPCSAERTQ
jgi:hypothetical protein